MKRAGHGWVHAYQFKTRTIKVLLSLWDKHAIMHLMKIAVCFDGRISYRDHICTFQLRVLSLPSPFSNIIYFSHYAFSLTTQILFFIHLLPTRSRCRFSQLNSLHTNLYPHITPLPSTIPSSTLIRLNSRNEIV